MHNTFLKFSFKTIGLLLVVFCGHLIILYFLGYPLFNDRIVASYVANTVLVITIFGVIYKLKNKYKSQLGLLFMIGSALKFAMFFILFYPFYKHDGDISRLEFTAFFIPYAAGLIFETLSLSKWLNSMD